jgi:muramoyltetrapeptide carboxypeptidase LdcA involved in peptidoglycan recycling
VLTASPKPFFGYSENTNLHVFPVNLGLVSYLGGSIMVQFGGPLVSARTSGTPSHSTSFRAAEQAPSTARPSRSM